MTGLGIVELLTCVGGLIPATLAVGGVLLFIVFARKRAPQAPHGSQPTPAIRVCSSCGAGNPPDYDFCDRCGARL